MRWNISRRDLRFIIETLMPHTDDPEGEIDRVRSDASIIEGMLDDELLFRRLMTQEAILLRASPWLFFIVLLRRARRELAGGAFTMERRDRQTLLIFDTDQVTRLLEQDATLDYLASMLASFTRIDSVSVPIQVREGVWRLYRTSDLDAEGLMRYCQALDPEFRFGAYKRIADVCLFMVSVFPEYVASQHRYPASRQVRPRMRGRVLLRMEDYEAHGRTFYRLAAEHEQARVQELDDVLQALAEHFILAEKPLSYLANRYLGFARHRLFDM
jgi:hypothetical protein